MNPKKITAAILSAALTLPSVSYALPDVSKGMPQIQGEDVSLNGLTVYRDVKSTAYHDAYPTNTLYVAPRNSKKFIGRYANVGASINCGDLHRMRHLTYMYPSAAELPEVVRGDMPYSPAFEANFGVNARNMRLLTKIANMEFEVSEFLLANKEEYGNYQAAKEHLDGIVMEKADLDDQEEDALQKLNSAILVIDPTLTAEQRAEEISNLRTAYRNKVVEISSRRQELNRQLRPAKKAYRKALSKWAPYKDQLSHLTAVRESLTASFSQIRTLAIESLTRSESQLNVLDSKVVGTATAGYNIFDTEQDELRSIVDSAGMDFDVSELPIFNVRLNPGVFKSLITSNNNFQPSLGYEANTMVVPSGTRQMLPATEKHMPSSFTSEEGDEVHILMAIMDPGYSRSGDFETFVTQGARCGYPKLEQVDMEYTDEHGETLRTAVQKVIYEDPTPNQAVFVQRASLRYNFYSKAEPLKGSCTIDTKMAESYYRNAGSKRSWSLFRGTRSRSWDNTKRRLNNDFKLSCKITYNPTGADQEQSEARKVAFEQALYDDMMAMFLLQFAKSYTIEKMDPPMQSGKDKPLTKIGNAVINLCGANVYCQIGNIVLKTMDEIGGVRHTGSTSADHRMTSLIKKDFELNDYLIAEGSSEIEMRVCVDHAQCE